MEEIELLSNLDKVHTTSMGIGRIKRNLSLNEDDIVNWCVNKIIIVKFIGKEKIGMSK